MNLIERIGDAPVFYAIRILVLLVLLIVVLAATGCSSRLITPEQEAQIAESCGPEFDCYVVKGDLWRQIIKYFESQVGI
jgi:hypothetical protein